MARAAFACALPTLVITFAWLRLEDPRLRNDALVVIALALVPAFVPSWRLRAPALLAAGLGACAVAFETRPWELAPFRDAPVLRPLLDSVGIGIGDFYGVVLPFDPGRHPEMHGLLLLAIFGFVSATAVLVATGRPFSAAAVVACGSGWPATLLDAGAAFVGVLALAAVFWIFVVLRAHSFGAAAAGAAAAAALVGVATWMSTATSFAERAALEWETWDFRGLPAKALGVRFVWDANYDGISFPATKTTVLEIEGPERAEYWRASTLDLFTTDRWIEGLYPTLIARGDRIVPSDELTPRRVQNQASWVEQRVRVKALVDDRIVAAGTPAALDARSLGTVFFLSGGVMRARQALAPGTRYRVWSYIPDPAPAALAASAPRYPPQASRFTTVWGRTLPFFGTPGRDAQMESLLTDPQFDSLGEYRPLYAAARQVVGNAGTAYGAVLALESWFRTTGGFRYDERPPRSPDTPALIDFVLTTKAGYCQHYAGAMALLLRLLGIPARVAVGFTSGTYDDGTWKVTDHDAHAWVEAWFSGHGWVAFDPTPGRGSFAGQYSYASENAQAVEALRRGDLRGATSPTTPRRVGDAGRPTGADVADDTAPSLAAVVLLLGGTWILGVGLGKAGVRRFRYLSRDPRRVATASRRELEDFLRDQGVDVPRAATLGGLQESVNRELGVEGARFASAASRARFGPPAEARRGALAARNELRALLKRARRELSLWARFRGFVSLRSLRGI